MCFLFGESNYWIVFEYEIKHYDNALNTSAKSTKILKHYLIVFKQYKICI